ncbi:hypothetical protein Cgig2_007168 [Carnegiea gigantea]|uniref:Uncharacterized protein n=1 Tax=Carnegiea gigantea TaxID=171969 RepID=A0A9Q1JSB9_9CARY|nr:hypothetical protein Cgig2_007168 [Carnegiea gigantea]
MDGLKNFMSTMANTIMQQVSEQVKKAMEAVSSAKPLPRFDYVPTMGYEPSHRHGLMASHRHSDGVREGARPDRNGRSQGENRDRSGGADTLHSLCPSQERSTKSTTASTPEHPMLKRPPSMTSAPKPHNAQKYCEFHEQNGHMTAKCRELRKALREMADNGQIDRFLKRGSRFLRKECEPAWPGP